MSVATVPSTTFSEVLLASDFSEESDRALTYAKSIVRGSEGSFFSFTPLSLLRSSPSRKECGSTTPSEFEQKNKRRKKPPLYYVRRA